MSDETWGGVDKFLAAAEIGGEPLGKDDRRAILEQLQRLQAMTAAQLAEQGYRQLTLVHGDLESAEDIAALRELSRWCDRHPGAVVRTSGTNDTLTWLFAPPDADEHLTALHALVTEHNPGWWRTRPGW